MDTAAAAKDAFAGCRKRAYMYGTLKYLENMKAGNFQ
jgi:hypothetical protein